MYKKWQWWWGEELLYPQGECTLKFYGLYRIGHSFIGYMKMEIQ